MLITQIWYRQRKSFFIYFLIPLMWLYRFVMAGRALLYRKSLLKSQCFPIPVIVIGNLTVGGTGKTPLVEALAIALKRLGFNPGIVSRGYKATIQHFPHAVSLQDDPQRVGDEPYLLANNTRCPVVIAPKRAEAVSYLLKTASCNVILSDDGLQHYALGRTLEIAVIDAQRGLGNQYCLPAGPLREPISRLRSVSCIVYSDRLGLARSKNLRIAGIEAIPQFQVELKNTYFIQLIDETKRIPVEEGLGKLPIHLVIGIGAPEMLFTRLNQLKIPVIRHIHPDHTIYKASDFEFGDDNIILMTQKDAVKCKAFADKRFWVIDWVADLEPALLDFLVEKIHIQPPNREGIR
jgi:tetraacyldisaccharide 4'-kinase